MKRIFQTSLVLMGLGVASWAQSADAGCSASIGLSESHCSIKVESLGCSGTLIAQCKRRVPQNEYSYSQSLLAVEASDSLRQAIAAIPFAGKLKVRSC